MLSELYGIFEEVPLVDCPSFVYRSRDLKPYCANMSSVRDTALVLLFAIIYLHYTKNV